MLLKYKERKLHTVRNFTLVTTIIIEFDW